MKKHFYFLLMAALVCGLSLSVTSCKDDDKNDEGQLDQQDQVEQDKDNDRFSVLDHLADVDKLHVADLRTRYRLA